MKSVNFEAHTITHRFYRIGGEHLRIACTDPERAEGPPLLIFNGIGASAEILEPLMRRITRLRTITFDVPGVGASQVSTRVRRLPGFARLARDVLDTLGVERVHVMGVSWGGGLAQQFARQYPERVDRLVLAATSPGHIMVPGRLAVLLRMATPLRYFSAGFFKHIAGDIYGGDFRTDAALTERYARRMAPLAVLGYLNQLYAVAGWTSLHWLHTLRQPALVMAGEDDPIVPLANARILACRIPDAELEVFDCGHLFIFTRLEQTAARLERFLFQSAAERGSIRTRVNGGRGS